MTPKDYYSFYEADDNLSELSHELIDTILEYEPNHVFEFGSGSGKHLVDLEQTFGIASFGMDISRANIVTSMFKHDLSFIARGSQDNLRHLCNFDVVFTCSVLDHIEDVEGIIGEFKRIANKAIVLAEPIVHNPEMMYFKHDYEDFGFKKLDYEWKSPADGNTYFIWELDKREIN